MQLITFARLEKLVLEAPRDQDGRPLVNATLGRRPADQAVYRAFRKEHVEGQWVSMAERLLHKVFAWEKTADAESGLWRAARPGPDAVRQVMLTPNDFPYWFEPGMFHFVLWASKGVLPVPEIEEWCRRLEAERRCRTVWWVNPPHYKSIPEIEHVHIVTFRKGATEEEGSAALPEP